MQPGVSLTDLLPGVDITRYYRYLGSLTTPSCNEAVVWSVFKDTIKVSRDVVSHKYNGRANRHKRPNGASCTSNWLHALFSRLTASALCSASPTAHRLSSLITTETSSQPYGSQRSLPAPPARPPEPATPWGWCSWAFFWGGLKELSNAVVSYQFMELHVNRLCIQGARSSPHEVNDVTTLQAGAWERVALHWVYRGDVVKLQQRNLWDISFF